MKHLSREDRLQLMRFVCSFAWADLEVAEAEREYVRRLVRKLEMGPDEARHVEEWLEVPPPIDEVDPARVPLEHRKLFLDTVREMARRDGVVDPEEAESVVLLDQLLR